MNRRRHVDSFLHDAEGIISQLENESWQDKTASTYEVDAAKLSSTLNHLKTSLEYLSSDIYETVEQTTISAAKTQPGKKSIGQFPYGKTEADFRSMIGSRHPNLRQLRPNLYHLLESIQPYKLGRSVIYDLCSDRNIVAHDSTEQSVRPTGERIIATAGHNLLGLEPNASVKNSSFKFTTVNGEKLPEINFDKDGQMSVLGDASKVVVSERMSAYLVNSNNDLINLLVDAHSLISDLKDKVYQIL